MCSCLQSFLIKCSPDKSGPVVDSIVDEGADIVGAGADQSGAADAQHEHQGGEDVDPEVDHHHQREDEDAGVAGAGVLDPRHPDCACDQPAQLEQHIHWK